MKKLLGLVVVLAGFYSCNSPAGTGTASASDSACSAITAKDSIEARNKATALACVEAFSQGKFDDAFKDAAPDLVEYGNGEMTPMKGKDTIVAAVKRMMAPFPDFHGSNFILLADSNMVAVIADWSGTFKNAYMKMKPNGKSFKVRDVDLFTFNDAGKMTEHRNAQSGMEMMSQLGLKMPH
jgi:predicted ester cyclase